MSFSNISIEKSKITDSLELRYLSSKDSESYQSMRLQALQQYPERYYRDVIEEQDRSNENVCEILKDRNKIGNFILGAFYNEKLCAILGFHRYEPIHINHRAYLYGCYIDNSVCDEEKVYHLLIQRILDEALLVPKLEQVEATTILSKESKILEQYGFEQYGFLPKSIKVENQFYDEFLYKKIIR
ncbi:TPA: GNAT family N-acetyltransferase [Bacillus cereus]|uniref:GNAT family N-acetyltransferase n=1 Tax=Bacillus thuringiensis TaxID=1428 RepID=UPI000BF7228C|nr:GNAT family N-acetyltransferase [Bacillus thuringiensis]PFU70327.1 hypothetical protein COK95_09465 [Bacillus thuringiensis]HDR8128040.1 GNAT family N-acetyltransferase [Bacillus cereus]HDR8493514.1 GNAT family N-acetyltransferase [Bacillus cereus]